MTLPPVAITPDDINNFIKGAFPGIGSDCIEVGPRHAVARRIITTEHIRPGGYVSGPTQFAIADGALWYALFGAVGIEAMALTSELSIRFLRPAVGTALIQHQLRRAEAVYSALIGQGGVAANRVFMSALPKMDLPVLTDREIARPENRSVELLIVNLPIPAR